MKTSTEIQSIVDVVGEEKTIEMIAKAGFDAWDFSMFNMKKRSFVPTYFLSFHPVFIVEAR